MTPNKTSSVKTFGAGRGWPMSCSASNRNPARDEQQNCRNHRRRERFGLAVAVGMVFVRRCRRHDDAAPDDDGTENVRERFAGVGHQRVRMAGDAGNQFCRREQDIHRQPDEGGAQAAFKAVRLHAGIIKHEPARNDTKEFRSKTYRVLRISPWPRIKSSGRTSRRAASARTRCSWAA